MLEVMLFTFVPGRGGLPTWNFTATLYVPPFFRHNSWVIPTHKVSPLHQTLVMYKYFWVDTGKILLRITKAEVAVYKFKKGFKWIRKQ